MSTLLWATAISESRLFRLQFAYRLQQDCRAQHLLRAGLRYRSFPGDIGLAQEYSCPPLLRLHDFSTMFPIFQALLHTSFRDLGECQARTPLKVDILRVDKGAQSVERFAREEVRLGSL